MTPTIASGLSLLPCAPPLDYCANELRRLRAPFTRSPSNIRPRVIGSVPRRCKGQDVDPETTRTVITVGGGIVSALGGVGIGYTLSQRSAAMDREFIERQRVRELQELGARDFSKALNEAGREVPTGVMRVSQSGRRIGGTHREVREAWGEAGSLFLRNSDIVRAVAALDCINSVSRNACDNERSMKLLQKVALVAAATTLILSGMALMRGAFHDAAVGVFVAACALFTSGMWWPTKPPWRRRKG